VAINRCLSIHFRLSDGSIALREPRRLSKNVIIADKNSPPSIPEIINLGRNCPSDIP
jgi:hypothetical protein